MALPFYPYGTWRPYGVYALGWGFVQPTQGAYVGNGSDQSAMVFDWSSITTALDAAFNAGISVCYPTWQTPIWAGSTPRAGALTLGATTGATTATSTLPAFTAGDVGKAISTGPGRANVTGFNSTTSVNISVTSAFSSLNYANGLWFCETKGPWDVAGESNPLNNVQYIRDFYTTLLRRFNTPGSRKITFVEGRNEPFPTVSPPYWAGTNAQLVAEQAAMYQACKSVDPGIIVLSPSLLTESTFQTFCSTQDPATGLYGYQTFDWSNVHSYGSGPNKVMSGTDLYFAGAGFPNRVLAALGQSPKPYACTEWGVWGDVGADTAAFAALTAAQRKLYIQRILASAALSGYSLFTIFSYTPLAGNYSTDTTGVIAAVQDVNRKLAGQTIIAGGFNTDGSVTVTLANGVTYTW